MLVIVCSLDTNMTKKAYKLLEIHTNKVFYSRDVIFMNLISILSSQTQCFSCFTTSTFWSVLHFPSLYHVHQRWDSFNQWDFSLLIYIFTFFYGILFSIFFTYTYFIIISAYFFRSYYFLFSDNIEYPNIIRLVLRGIVVNDHRFYYYYLIASDTDITVTQPRRYSRLHTTPQYLDYYLSYNVTATSTIPKHWHILFFPKSHKLIFLT